MGSAMLLIFGSAINIAAAMSTAAMPMSKSEATAVLDKVYSGYSMSAHGAHHGGGLYGETGYEGLGGVLDKIGATSSMNFYDLGSGNGKLNLFGSMVYGFKKSVGVELSTSRHEQACRALELLKGNSTDPGLMPSSFKGSVEFVAGDFSYTSVSDADIIFGGLLPDDKVQKMLADKFRTMKNGAKILMLRELNEELLTNIKKESADSYKLGWQSAHPIYEYSRKDGEKSPPDVKKEEDEKKKQEKDAEDKKKKEEEEKKKKEEEEERKKKDEEYRKRWGSVATAVQPEGEQPPAAQPEPQAQKQEEVAKMYVYEFSRDSSKPLQQDAPDSAGVQNQNAAAAPGYSSRCSASW